MIKIGFIFLIYIKMFAFTDLEIAEAIKKVAFEENINPKILYTIVKIESNFNPKIISMLLEKDEVNKIITLNRKNKFKVSFYDYALNSNKKIVNILAYNKDDLVILTQILKENNFSFDVGLAQINSYNFSISEVEQVVSLEGNLRKATQILKSCIVAKKDIENAIECYNYGLKPRKKNIYFARFKKSFIKDFGV
ncbi:transglycosylase SLT domain-containing protein [Campylobacter sp. RM12651]|uniref:transglycosylase SLT domain-containing protein n=1 Tax=Campylobacter sp. RM12651 TaxID=1660079 RepID=UPI001EFB8D96|nr:transglycosylase SLT domain-containing protein [Campylobacter sp. RM12651]ULO04496.1 putative lytic transglycosylase [Campylobacter sp. RM12651]